MTSLVKSSISIQSSISSRIRKAQSRLASRRLRTTLRQAARYFLAQKQLEIASLQNKISSLEIKFSEAQLKLCGASLIWETTYECLQLMITTLDICARGCSSPKMVHLGFQSFVLKVRQIFKLSLSFMLFRTLEKQMLVALGENYITLSQSTGRIQWLGPTLTRVKSRLSSCGTMA